MINMIALRRVSVCLLLLSGLWLLPLNGASAAEVCTNDTGGVDDAIGQSDLTQFCLDFANVPINGTYDATMNFDPDSFNGNNTGDACFLFDTDFDSNVNFAICNSVGGNPGSLESGPVLYSCDNEKPDRCTNPTVTAITGDTTCTAAVDNTDPFPTGDDSPDDTVVSCTIDTDDIPAGGVKMNACSYPSDNPNSDPKDCVLDIVEADMSITKTDNLDYYPLPVSSVTYTIVVTNNGPNDVPAVSVVDFLPDGISSASWTCSADAGSSCGAASGSGELLDYPAVENGDSVTYMYTVDIPAGFTGSLTNTAVVVGTDDVDGTNNSATDVDLPEGSLTLVKVVDNALGGTATTTSFVLDAAGAQIQSLV